jgi:hypothetical protein
VNQISGRMTLMLMCILGAICCIACADDTNGNSNKKAWIESTNVTFDGRIGFHQETMGSMDDLVVKFKRGEKGVKIFAAGRIVDRNGGLIEVFDEVPAKFISRNGMDYFQFEKGGWRLRSSATSNAENRKIFKRQD